MDIELEKMLQQWNDTNRLFKHLFIQTVSYNLWERTFKSVFNIVNAQFHINFYHSTAIDNEQLIV